MIQRYFITGATGFVGSNIVRSLVHGDNHVCVFARNKNLNWRLSDIRNRLTIYEGDFHTTDFSSLFQKEKPTVVFHLASYGTTPKENSFADMMDVNIKGLHRLLRASQNSSIRLFVNTGSSSEYGIKTKKMNEDDPIQPINEYGVSKAAATLLCQEFSKQSSFTLTTFRLFSPYGPYDEPTRFIPSVINAGLTRIPLAASSPKFVRDFIFIDDIVRAYIMASRKRFDALNGHIINIGSGKEETLGSIVELAEKIVRKKILLHWNEKPKQERQIEPKKWQADIRKAMKLLGWTPKYTIQSGLEQTMTWMIQSNITI
jgi:nucleoside-diphosphate-sugar epimerase